MTVLSIFSCYFALGSFKGSPFSSCHCGSNLGGFLLFLFMFFVIVTSPSGSSVPPFLQLTLISVALLQSLLLGSRIIQSAMT